MRRLALVFLVSPLLVGIAARRPIFAAPSSTIPPRTLAYAPGDDEGRSGDEQKTAAQRNPTDEHAASPAPPAAANAGPKPTKGDDAPDADVPWWRDPTWITAIFTVVAGVSTAIYAIIASCTLSAINRQAKIAEDSISHLERPWIIPEPKTDGVDDLLQKALIQRQVGAKPWPLRYALKNTGRSPAFIFHRHVHFTVVPDVLTHEPPHGEKGIDLPPPIGAGESPVFTGYLDGGGSIGTAGNIIVRGFRLVFHAVIAYRDTIDEKAIHTSHCYHVFIPSEVQGGMGKWEVLQGNPACNWYD